MNCLSTTLQRDVNDAFPVQVAFQRGGTPDMICFIRGRDMQRIFISFRVNRDRLNAHIPRSPRYADSNFTAICNQDF
jgi:hypothetical protein